MSPDGRLYAAAAGYADGRFRVWNVETGRVAAVLEGLEPSLDVPTMRWLDGSRVLVAFTSDKLAAWNGTTGQAAGTVEARRGNEWTFGELDGLGPVAIANSGPVAAYELPSLRVVFDVELRDGCAKWSRAAVPSRSGSTTASSFGATGRGPRAVVVRR